LRLPCDLRSEEAGVARDDLCALGAYEGALRRLVLAAKHSPRRDLGPFLAECGEGLGAALAGRASGAS